jgi:hypothetical protein
MEPWRNPSLIDFQLVVMNSFEVNLYFAPFVAKLPDPNLPFCDPCIPISQTLRATRKVSDIKTSPTRIILPRRRKGAKFGKEVFSSKLCALASLREIFRISVAAPPRWALCG